MNSTEKIFIIVLGMHRSATSLTSLLLSKMGAYIGKECELIKGGAGNPKGLYELVDVVCLNNRILYDSGTLWCDVLQNIPEFPPVYGNEIAKIVKKLSSSADGAPILIKDPRMCLVEPLWKTEIENQGYKIKYVVVFRHPYEVASSLKKRDKMSFTYGVKLWFFYNLAIFSSVIKTSTENVVFLNHNDYYENPQNPLGTLISFMDRRDTYKNYMSYIDPDLRHNRRNDAVKECASELFEPVLKMYQQMEKCSQDSSFVRKFPYDDFADSLEVLANTSYVANGLDLAKNAIKNTRIYELKDWCIIQLKKRPDSVKKSINEYAKKCEVKKISVYGNGRISRELYPILDKLNGYTYAVYDIKNHESVIICGKTIIPSVFDREICHIDELVINTAIFYENEVWNNISDCIQCKYFISIFDLIYDYKSEK